MKDEATFKEAVRLANNSSKIAAWEREVVGKYGPVFKKDAIDSLDPEQFRAFLRFSENKHWSGINRGSTALTSDVVRLREALSVLLDESRPISDRIDQVTGAKGTPMIRGLGPAIISAILLVSEPEKYGVYNQLSVAGLEHIGLNPATTVRGFSSLSLGDRYDRVNQVLTKLHEDYQIRFWALDWVWYQILYPADAKEDLENPSSPSSTLIANPAATETSGSSGVTVAGSPVTGFALESFLEDFLVENWDRTPLNQRLEIYTDSSTGDATGKQFRTEVGRIDILCRNKPGPGYTVIELKRDKSLDAVVGQLQRYMGWVKRKLAKPGEPVRGLIICRTVDPALPYALEVAPDISYFTYEVQFDLKEGKPLGS